jgi:AraC-like DNA-binding protein
MRFTQFKKAFLAQINGYDVFEELFNLLPDVAFFIKDRQGRFVMGNRRSCDYFRVSSPADILGRTDYDFFPKDRADIYVAGDRQVMETGKAILNVIEPAPEEAGSDRLILCNKIPVKDRRGQIIGVAGIHREIDARWAQPQSFGRLSTAVQHIHEQYAEPLSMAALAKAAGFSHSQFDRRFRRLFGVSPQQYLVGVRAHAACRLLERTHRKLTDIALAVGFCDHSHFARSFRRIMGLSASQYRKKHMPM